MKKDIKLKGQLKLYMQWPGIMILFLILMNIWIFRMDRKAGLLMSAFVLVYAVVIGIMYFYNKSLILADMVEFAAQYGIVQNTLLKELSIPYAILLDDGKIIWTNTQFREVLGTTIRKDTYLSKYIPELNRGVFPKEENESVSLEFNFLHCKSSFTNVDFLNSPNLNFLMLLFYFTTTVWTIFFTIYRYNP